MKKTYDTIILGGGVSGLGCARTLTDAGHHNFLLLTKELNGRVPHSSDGQVNYGTFYARADYHHVLPYLTLGRQIDLHELAFVSTRLERSLFDVRNLPHLKSLTKFLSLVAKTYRHYRTMQRRTLEVGQAQAIREDTFLFDLIETPATELIKRYKFEYWARYFINPVIRSTSYLDVYDDRITGFMMLACWFPALVPTYEFQFNLEHLVHPFFNRIALGEADYVRRVGATWHVADRSGYEYRAKHLVAALPMHITKKMLNLPLSINDPVSVYMFHVRGNIKKRYAVHWFEMFEATQDIVIVREPNDTYLFYSRRMRPDFSKYFVDYEIITKRHWDPAFYMGSQLVDTVQPDNLYIIGDHNVPCMEDAFLTGVYAARQIYSGKHQ